MRFKKEMTRETQRDSKRLKETLSIFEAAAAWKSRIRKVLSSLSMLTGLGTPCPWQHWAKERAANPHRRVDSAAKLMEMRLEMSSDTSSHWDSVLMRPFRCRLPLAGTYSCRSHTNLSSPWSRLATTKRWGSRCWRKSRGFSATPCACHR